MSEAAKNSHDSYRDLKESGKLGSVQRSVLAALREAKRPVTGRELEHYKVMHGAWKRLPELEKAGYAERCGSVKCMVTGRKSTAWIATS